MALRQLAWTAAAVSRLGLRTLSAGNALIAGYLGALTLAAVRRPPARAHVNAQHRFVILVPAHNEESVIADSMRAFRQLDYDAALFSVHVVADNCVDATADIVREHGWIAHERAAPDRPGKGPALNWLFDRVDSMLKFDVVLVVDADTVLDPGFLTAMDVAFADGAVAAQGYYSVRDPGTSAAAGVRFAALACRHHLRPLGRNRLGASCGLYGNGMAFRRDLLARRRWSGHLVEDAEFQMELLLREGIRVTYVPDAVLEAEMPSTLAASTSQNERWERGRLDLARRYVPQLLRSLASAKGRRVAHADAIVDHLVPPLSAVVMLEVLGCAAASLGTLLTGRRRTRARLSRLALLNLATLGVVGVHVIVGLRAVAAPRSVYRSLSHAPQMVVWKVRLWSTALRPRSDVTWQRTKRNAER